MMEGAVRAVMEEARAWKDGFDDAGLGFCSKEDAVFLAVAAGLERAYAVGMDWVAGPAPKAKTKPRARQVVAVPATAGVDTSTNTPTVGEGATTVAHPIAAAPAATEHTGEEASLGSTGAHARAVTERLRTRKD